MLSIINLNLFIKFNKNGVIKNKQTYKQLPTFL